MKRVALLLLLACSKKAPPPAVVVEAAAPPASSVPAPSCDLTVQTGTAGVDVVTGARVAGTKRALCRADACAGAPPWIIEPEGTANPGPTSLVTSLSDNRLAVLVVGVTGAGSCESGRNAVNRHIDEPKLEDDVIVYDEETTPLRPGDEGCEQAGPPTHVWHAVDTRTKKEWVIRGDVTVTVEANRNGSSGAIVAKKAGCSEIRYSR